MIHKPKILVGLSGGIDSSVTACLLQEQGFDVIGIHLRFWTDPAVFTDEEQKKFPQNKCCTLEGLNRARQMAHRLGFPLYVLNFEEEFKKDVVDPFIAGYAQGVTPNPCIECNRKIKFGLFLKKMKELGADYIATGHYARKVTINENGRERYELWAAKDKVKDQSYFLYTLTQEKLKHILFPLGEFTKDEVRHMAKKFGIDEMNRQRESQDLCFFPEQTHTPFLQRHLQKKFFKPGPIVTVHGEKVGTHAGLPNYTIGQRRGLGVGGVKGHEEEEGQSWYVVRIDKTDNALIVGREQDLLSKKFNAHAITFISGQTTPVPQRIEAKIRFRFPQQPATLKIEKVSGTGKNEMEGTIEFERPQRAITAGQSVVFYDGEKILGGGIIA